MILYTSFATIELRVKFFLHSDRTFLTILFKSYWKLEMNTAFCAEKLLSKFQVEYGLLFCANLS